VWERLQALAPDDRTVAAALNDSLEREAKWRQLAATYAAEAEGAPDDVYRAPC
jgi:hypothetical protein